jgi:hypothetical protein
VAYLMLRLLAGQGEPPTVRLLFALLRSQPRGLGRQRIWRQRSLRWPLVGRFRRQQWIARCCAGSYRHVLSSSFISMDGGCRMCFRKSLAHSRKTQLPKAAWAPQLEPVQPRQSPPPRATSRVPSGAVPHGATQPSRQARTKTGFSSSGVMSSRVLPIMQSSACSRASRRG